MKQSALDLPVTEVTTQEVVPPATLEFPTPGWMSINDYAISLHLQNLQATFGATYVRWFLKETLNLQDKVASNEG